MRYIDKRTKKLCKALELFGLITPDPPLGRVWGIQISDAKAGSYALIFDDWLEKYVWEYMDDDPKETNIFLVAKRPEYDTPSKLTPARDADSLKPIADCIAESLNLD